MACESTLMTAGCRMIRQAALIACSSWSRLIDPPTPSSVAVRRKSFVFFRNPRSDALDPETGERYDDVIAF